MGDPAAANKLLAMLRAGKGGSSPSITSPPPGAPVSQASGIPVSLNDLFANIGQLQPSQTPPSAPSAISGPKSAISPPPPVVSSAASSSNLTANHLLGMLRNGGSPSSAPATPPVVPSVTDPAIQGSELVESESKSPAPAIAPSAAAPLDLLSLLKKVQKPPASSATADVAGISLASRKDSSPKAEHNDDVDAHVTAQREAASLEPKEEDQDGNGQSATADSGVQHNVKNDEEHGVTSEEKLDTEAEDAPVPSEPAALAPPPPNKTIFDFVSPFDMFSKPKAASSPTPVSVQAETKPIAAMVAANKPKPKKVKEKEKEKGKEQVGEPKATQSAPVEQSETPLHGPSAVAQNGFPSTAMSPPAPSTSARPMAFSQASTAPEHPSPAVSTSSLAGASSQNDDSKRGKVVYDPRKTWLVGDVTAGLQGTGPSHASAHLTIDLSKPNLDALVNDKQAIHVDPITITKPVDPGFRCGRVMGVTDGWLAYGLSKGRIRLIDRVTGSRLVISLGGSAASGFIVDMAVTPTLLAVISADHSISAYRIPPTWSQDDTEVERLVYLHGPSAEIGVPFKVEWTFKDSTKLLAVGGKNGVVLMNPFHLNKKFSDVVRKHKVLTTEGDLVDFCFNSTNLAIGLISATSIFSLFSISSLGRVWHRPFPSQTAADSPPSSVMFIESNLLVGRERNTCFDLVQISGETGVIGSISLLAPAPCPAEYHYSHVAFDAAHQTIWIAPFARGSLIGLRYTRRGSPPVKVSQGEAISPWDVLGEFHTAELDPIISLTHAPGVEGQAFTTFYVHTKGFNLASIKGHILANAYGSSDLDLVSAPSQARMLDEAKKEAEDEELGGQVMPSGSPAPAVASPSPSTFPPQTMPSTPQRQADPFLNQPSPARMDRQGPSACDGAKSPVVKVEADLPAPSAAPSANIPRSAATPILFDKQLKKMEDRIITQTRQAISSSSDKIADKVDAISGDALAAKVVTDVGKLVKSSVIEAVRDEAKRTISQVVQHEIRLAIPAAIATSARQILPSELERELGSLLHHILPGAVQAAVDRSIASAVQRVIVPEMSRMVSQMTEEVMDNVREEMLQIKKDFSPPPEATPSLPIDLTKVTDLLNDMQRQIISLSEQVARQNVSPVPLPLAPQPPIPASRPPPVQASVQPQHIMSPGRIPAPLPAQHRRPSQVQPPPPVPQHPASVPSNQQIEDAFLQALAQQSTASTVKLVNDYYQMSEYCLPVSGRPAHPGAPFPSTQTSPLSPAVQITLLHRLALALNELAPSDPDFARCLDWQERVVVLVDPQAPETSAYYPRVKEAAMGQLTVISQKIENEGMGGSRLAYALRALINALARKG